MKKSLRILALVLACVFLAGASVLAAGSSYTKDLTVSYVGVNLVVDGEPIVPKDANGNIVEPFIYEGTTYLPVRAVGEALGKTVSWDGATKTVYIGNVPGEDIYLLDVCPPYESKNFSAPETISIMGTEYQKSFTLTEKVWTTGSEWISGYAYFNLNSNYDTLSFDVGHIDGTDLVPKMLKIYLDGKLLQTIDLYPDMLLTHYDVELNGTLQLRMVMTGNSDGNAVYGFANAILK